MDANISDVDYDRELQLNENLEENTISQNNGDPDYITLFSDQSFIPSSTQVSELTAKHSSQESDDEEQHDDELKTAEIYLLDELIQTEAKEKLQKAQRDSEFQTLSKEVALLRKCILAQETQISQLTQQNVKLKKNICSLCKTAQDEIQRKDEFLSEANRKLDAMRLRWGKPNQSDHQAMETSSYKSNPKLGEDRGCQTRKFIDASERDTNGFPGDTNRKRKHFEDESKDLHDSSKRHDYSYKRIGNFYNQTENPRYEHEDHNVPQCKSHSSVDRFNKGSLHRDVDSRSSKNAAGACFSDKSSQTHGAKDLESGSILISFGTQTEVTSCNCDTPKVTVDQTVVMLKYLKESLLIFEKDQAAMTERMKQSMIEFYLNTFKESGLTDTIEAQTTPNWEVSSSGNAIPYTMNNSDVKLLNIGKGRGNSLLQKSDSNDESYPRENFSDTLKDNASVRFGDSQTVVQGTSSDYMKRNHSSKVSRRRKHYRRDSSPSSRKRDSHHSQKHLKNK